MRSNILISTTRQWNPGDEFIMQGALNALTNTFGDCYNPIIFNRNPNIRGGGKWRNPTRTAEYTYKMDRRDFRGKGYLHEIFSLGQYDNSYKDGMNPDCISLALFAGSPEWYGTRLRPMFQFIEENQIPTIFLGIGMGDATPFSRCDAVVRRVLSQAKLITTRDRDTEEMLQEYGARYMTCPAFLAAPTNRLVKKVEKIGLIYATDHTVKGNNVSQAMHDYILRLYPEIMKRYSVGLVCHYIDEIEQAKKEFPDADVFYSYDSKDYADIYNHFDLVVGGRVHGIGISGSLGIPGIMIQHDSRSSTTDGFLAEKVSCGTPADEVLDKIEQQIAGIEAQSQKLIDHKQSVMEAYCKRLSEAISL